MNIFRSIQKLVGKNPRRFPADYRLLPVFGFFLAGFFSFFCDLTPAEAGVDVLDKIKTRGFLLWGADAEGGGPYVFPDPSNPNKMVGFEVDLAEALAADLGVKAKQGQNAWESLIPGLVRGDFDIVMNGIEITPQKEQVVQFSRPYYVFTEQLVVRTEEMNIQGLKDLKGKKAGTLSGAIARDFLAQEEGIQILTYSGQSEPFTDLTLGRLDGVLLDMPIAVFYARSNPKLKFAGPPVGKGFYGIAIRKGDSPLKEKIDGSLERMVRTGELKKIYDKWGLWNDFQNGLADTDKVATMGADLAQSQSSSLLSFMPMLLRGAGVTLFISVISMALAMSLGLVLAIMRVYSGPWLRFLAIAYVEIYRGTPLLIQLYILYYGLPNLGISLSPLLAAFIGLGMNYAAYEAELYRAGINAVSRGQMEAALSLGMTEWMALRRIILPQAFRIALPGITNDFIALFKDSSLVSVIAMVELTKTYNILAASTLRFFDLGIVVGLLYFAMSYPLSLFARNLEEKLKGGSR